MATQNLKLVSVPAVQGQMRAEGLWSGSNADFTKIIRQTCTMVIKNDDEFIPYSELNTLRAALRTNPVTLDSIVTTTLALSHYHKNTIEQQKKNEFRAFESRVFLICVSTICLSFSSI